MRILLLLSIALVSHFAKAGGTAIVTVGSDGACDYSSITAASFDEPASDLLEIRVAKNFTLSSAQLLNDRVTTIRGGYDACSDTTASDRTVLIGSGTGPIFVVIESTNTTTNMNLFLVDLEISGGNSSTSGGAITLTGGWLLGLDNVYIHNNSSDGDGGAIFIKPSTDVNVLVPRLIINGNSVISDNSAENGGAVACDGPGRITAFNMQMANNNATGNGGAVYVNDGCAFEQFGGGFLQGIFLNNADFGGGIYANNDSNILIKSNLGYGAALVLSNTANYGGGITVGGGSTLTAVDAVISGNSASISGGGISSYEGHVVIERSEPGVRCHTEDRCSVISDNSAGGANSIFAGGGAIAISSGTLEISGTYIENNNALFGSAIRARFMPLDGFDSQITMVGNVFAGNHSAPQVVYLDESSADISFSTFVDNEDMDRIIELSYPTTSSDGHVVTISGSIFSHPGTSVASAELTTAGQFPAGDCNRNESGSTGDLIGQPRSTTSTVFFEDQAGGDYRLLNNSTLNDWCDGSFLGIGSNYSANGFTKPIDNNVIPNLHGTYDLGGLERYDLDLIFADGFE